MYPLAFLPTLIRTMAVLSVAFWIFAVVRLARLSRERSRKDKLAVIVYGIQLFLSSALITGLARRISGDFMHVLFWLLVVLILVLSMTSLGVADKTSVIGRRIATAAILWLSSIGLALVMPNV